MLKYKEFYYEGNKIVVIKGDMREYLQKGLKFDPHFSENCHLIARFVPTENGWNMAIKFVNMVI